MKKLIIQIPCFNEGKTLSGTLADLPREIEGIDAIEWLVIDDGSTDNTIEVAEANGVDHIVAIPNNRGLANAFVTGIDACLERGADIIVNTDGDNQYCADDIPKLVQPILENRAEIVIGTRPIMSTKHFSPLKKILQRVGSWVVKKISKTDIADAPSGFRAFSRSAAMHLHVFNSYTYTLETIIQAGLKGMAITSVPIRTNEQMRKSRLMKSSYDYIKKSVMTIVRIFIVYRPLLFFMTIGSATCFSGGLIFLRFLYYFFSGDGDGHIQSLILGAVLVITGIFVCMVALITDLISVNRILIEKTNWRLQQLEDKIHKNT